MNDETRSKAMTKETVSDEPDTRQADNSAPSQSDAQTKRPGSGQLFKIQRVYLKDVSYESPQTPGLFVGKTEWKPNVSLHLNTESTKLENDHYECTLTVTVTVTLGEKTAYLAEVKQAGLFLIRGIGQAQLGPMLGSYCPNVLFPFAREAVASLVQQGGFPQLLLDPVNFDVLYTQHLEAAKQNAPAPQTPQ